MGLILFPLKSVTKLPLTSVRAGSGPQLDYNFSTSTLVKFENFLFNKISMHIEIFLVFECSSTSLIELFKKKKKSWYSLDLAMRITQLKVYLQNHHCKVRAMMLILFFSIFFVQYVCFLEILEYKG